jgi:stage V sporulation protein G
MEITEVRIKLMEDSDDRLQAFCSITFDNCFVVRDLKIIEGTSGPFVAMPSRKLTSHCHQCGSKNHLKAAYCNHCGARQRDDRTVRDAEGRAKLYADIAHPINSACRESIQNRVISEFRTELDRSKQPGYISRYDDDYDDDIDPATLIAENRRTTAAPPMPAGSHVEPGSPGPRAPHIVPAPSLPPGPTADPSTDSAQPRSSGSVPPPHIPPRESKPLEKQQSQSESAPPPANPKTDDFGAGIF